MAREGEGVRELISHIGSIPILIPLKLFLVTKFKFQNVISLSGSTYFIIFFSFEICVTRSFRNRHKISLNAKSKIWRQLCDVILPQKMSKLEKLKS